MRKLMDIRFIIGIICWVAALCIQAPAACVEGYEYLTTKGDTAREVLWCLDSSLPFRVFYKETDEWNITRTDDASATHSWKVLDSAGNVRILAERHDNCIRVEGSVKGRQVRKEIAIDGAPWFQATSWSLRRFVLSGESEIEFWTLRPDTLKAYKVIARRRTEEVLQLAKDAVPAVRIELRLTGMLAPFWKSWYWFRSKDGVFLRFEGPGGPPGTPELVIEYQRPISPQHLAAVDDFMRRLGDKRQSLKNP